MPRAVALGWRLLPLPVVAFAAFVASAPYLWPDPIGRTVALFRFRAEEMAGQGRIWSELDVTSRADALSRVGAWLGERRSTTGAAAQWLAQRAGIEWTPPMGIDLILAVAGALVLAALVLRQGVASPAALAAIVLGGETALIVLGMRADFERYLYPVLLAAVVCAGLFVGQGWMLVQAAAVRLIKGEHRVRSADASVSEMSGQPLRV